MTLEELKKELKRPLSKEEAVRRAIVIGIATLTLATPLTTLFKMFLGMMRGA